MTDYAISRDSRRVPLETRVSLRFERFSGFISEYSSNISPGGMFVRAQTPSPVGTLLDFEFQLGDGYPLIKGTGEVVWIRSDEQGAGKPAGMGIRFLRLSKGSRELIYKIVDEYIHQGGVPFDIEAGSEAVTVPPVPAPTAAEMSRPEASREPDAPPAPSMMAAAAARPEVPTAVVPDSAGHAGEAEVATAAMPLPIASAPPLLVDPMLAGLSLPDLAARSFGAAERRPAPAPLAEAAAPLSAYAADAAPRRRRWPSAHLAALAVVVAVLGLGAAAFVFQEPLMRQAGWLGRSEGEPAAASEASAAPAAGEPAPAAPATSSATAAGASSASLDAIPEPQASGVTVSPPPPQGADSVPAQPTTPSGPARPITAPREAAAPPATAPALTAIRSITWRLTGGDTELTVRGDGPIRPGSYTRARLEGGAPRELIKIRGIRRPFAPARLPVGSSQLKQVRTGQHAGSGGEELHLVLDLADSGVVVRGIDEVDGALVVRLGRG